MKTTRCAPTMLFGLALALTGPVGVWAQNSTPGQSGATQAPNAATQQSVAPAPSPLYTYAQDHDPDGIGKFYMGREIAQVMGHQAADWLDRPERGQEEQPDRMVRALQIKPGMVVADVGAGSGYISVKLARYVGAKGKVYAEDIQPEMLQIIRKKAAQLHLASIHPVLGTITDPKLPPGSTDLILLVDVYHEFDHPYEMTRAMVNALKPGGRLVLVEYRREDDSVPIKLLHKTSLVQIRKEMSVQNLTWIGSLEVLPWQHIIELKRPLEAH